MPGSFIENVFAKPKDVMTHPSLDVDCFIQRLEASRDALTLEVELREGNNAIARSSLKVPRQRPPRQSRPRTAFTSTI